MEIVIAIGAVLGFIAILSQNHHSKRKGSGLTVGKPRFGTEADRRGILVDLSEFPMPCGCVYKGQPDGTNEVVKRCDACQRLEDRFEAQQRARGY